MVAKEIYLEAQELPYKISPEAIEVRYGKGAVKTSLPSPKPSKKHRLVSCSIGSLKLSPGFSKNLPKLLSNPEPIQPFSCHSRRMKNCVRGACVPKESYFKCFCALVMNHMQVKRKETLHTSVCNTKSPSFKQLSLVEHLTSTGLFPLG